MDALRQCLFLLLSFVALDVAAHEKGTQFVLTHVAVIDCTGAPTKPEMTVVITDDRISALGRADEVTVPEGSYVVDCSGQYMIPRLWDMHVHRRPWARALFLANGVTGRRDMWGNAQLVTERDHVGATDYTYGAQVAFRHSPAIPLLRISVAAPILDGPGPVRQGSIVIEREKQARQVVRDFKSQGYDFLKIYDRLPREVYFAIKDEAEKANLPIAGHVPYTVTASEASDSGLATIEHLPEGNSVHKYSLDTPDYKHF